jgi:hypothetical protein
MKLVGIISTAVLSLTLGAVAPVYAQQEQHEQQEEQKDKPAKADEKKVQPEKSAKQEEKAEPQAEKNAKPEEKSAQQEKNAKPEERNAQQERRASGRIPEDRFRANFGREHTFHVSQADYTRDRRFQYGGYWFGFAQPWPANWLYTQDVFVVDIDGVYYLCNPTYPGVNIALSFTL